MNFSSLLGAWCGLSLVGSALAVGCSGGDDLVDVGSSSGSIGSSSGAVAVDQSVEAQSGRSAARSMAGGAVDGVDPGPAASADQAAWVVLRDAMLAHVVAIIDRDEPGAMAALGTALTDPSTEVRYAAWIAMRDRMDATVTSGKLDAELQKDQRFAGLATPQSLFGNTGVSLRDQTTYSDGGVCGTTPNLGRVNGVYGDGQTGALAAGKDLAGNLDMNPLNLGKIDRGELTPDPESRLGAYAATKGYPQGTVGNAVHRAIGGIYLAFGTYGEEKIGRVFNSPEANALYNDPVESASGLQIAEAEEKYWNNCVTEDGWSAGGRMGSLFPADLRERIQKAASLQNPLTSSPTCSDSCANKADGLYCSKLNPRAAYQCKGKSIAGAQYCDPDAGTSAKCNGPNGAGTTISCQ